MYKEPRAGAALQDGPLPSALSHQALRCRTTADSRCTRKQRASPQPLCPEPRCRESPGELVPWPWGSPRPQGKQPVSLARQLSNSAPKSTESAGGLGEGMLSHPSALGLCSAERSLGAFCCKRGSRGGRRLQIGGKIPRGWANAWCWSPSGSPGSDVAPWWPPSLVMRFLLVPAGGTFPSLLAWGAGGERGSALRGIALGPVCRDMRASSDCKLLGAGPASRPVAVQHLAHGGPDGGQGLRGAWEMGAPISAGGCAEGPQAQGKQFSNSSLMTQRNVTGTRVPGRG